VFAKALLETALECAGDEDSGDEEEMAKEEDQNALSVRIIDALNSRKSALHHSLIIWFVPLVFMV